MKTLARRYVCWPGIDSELDDSVKDCSKCQEHQHLLAKAPMHSWEWPDRPWACIHIDYICWPYRRKDGVNNGGCPF